MKWAKNRMFYRLSCTLYVYFPRGDQYPHGENKEFHAN